MMISELYSASLKVKESVMKKLVLIIALLLVVLYSTAYAAPPSGSKAGYVMFNNDDSNVIRSDGKGVYKDCSLGGTDQVEIRLTNTGEFNYLRFYPGVMKKTFFNCSETYSTRRVKFYFNVSNIPVTQTAPAGSDPEKYPDRAVQEILRWYKESGVYKERSNNTSFIDDNSLHTPICVHYPQPYDPPIVDHIQFALDPNPYPSPGTDSLSITQSSVDNFYPEETDNKDYWTTKPPGECAPYIVYTLVYGKVDVVNGKYIYTYGFDVTPVQWGKNKKPVTWIVRTKNVIPHLIVVENDFGNPSITLTTYSDPLPFEFAVSLNPIPDDFKFSSFKKAPPKIDTVSTTWGNIKGE